MMPPKLGILAGGGELPEIIVQACKTQGREFFVVAFEGQASNHAFVDEPHEWVRLGAAGKTVDLLRKAAVEELVMAGSIYRPPMSALRPDIWAARFFARFGAEAFGDDGLLSALIKTLENDEGFRVLGADEIVPNLVAEEGTFGAIGTNPEALSNIDLGVEAAKQLGADDLGQAAVVCGGKVIGLEDTAGTDALLERVGDDACGGVLVKVSKPGQEHRADLPSIGVATVERVSDAGISGIAVEAGSTLIIRRDDVVRAADAAGIFIVGVNPSKTELS